MSIKLVKQDKVPAKEIETQSTACVPLDDVIDSAEPLPGNVIHFKPGQPGDNSAESDWRENWETRRGSPINNLANVMVALREDPLLKGAFAFDEMALATFAMTPLPGSVAADGEWRPHQVRDVDINRVQEYLQTRGLSQIGMPVVDQAINTRAHERAFHPVRDYLTALTWDGKSRLSGWLTSYLGVPAGPYSEGVGSMFFLSLVARIFKPGSKSDHTLILEGRQGSEKSTACKVIGGQWFSDSLPEVSGKDAAQHLAGKWVVELGELAVTDRWEAASLKAFLTRAEDKYRPAYGRKEIHQRRQCVFIGTTNKSVYLKDTTGGRRFWPVRTNKIDIAALTEDRDQLFAEAVARFKAGHKWYPDAEFEKNHILPEQEARFEADNWEDRVREFIEGKASVRVGSILEALGLETSHRSTRNERRVTDILQRFGWRRNTKKDPDGNISWIPAT